MVLEVKGSRHRPLRVAATPYEGIADREDNPRTLEDLLREGPLRVAPRSPNVSELFTRP